MEEPLLILDFRFSCFQFKSAADFLRYPQIRREEAERLPFSGLA
jgi:hypothetical protein